MHQSLWFVAVKLTIRIHNTASWKKKAQCVCSYTFTLGNKVSGLSYFDSQCWSFGVTAVLIKLIKFTRKGGVERKKR